LEIYIVYLNFYDIRLKVMFNLVIIYMVFMRTEDNQSLKWKCTDLSANLLISDIKPFL